MVKIVKKITVKDVVTSADKEKYPKYGMVAGKETAHTLFLILGRISSASAENTDKGPYVMFRGVFEATRTCDGEKFKSTGLILPPPTQEVLFQGWADSAPKKEDGVTPDFTKAMPMAFAFNIGLEPHVGGITGYKFTCEPIDIGDDAETDPLNDIRAKALASLPQPAAVALPEAEAPKALEDNSAGKSKAKAS